MNVAFCNLEKLVHRNLKFDMAGDILQLEIMLFFMA